MTRNMVSVAALLTIFSVGMLLSDTCDAAYAAEVVTAESPAGKWKREYDGWTYMDESGDAVTDGWKIIKGKWYFFNKSGIMENNAYRNGYYLTNNGAWDDKPSVTGWKKIGNSWYYFHGSGELASDIWVESVIREIRIPGIVTALPY